MTDEYKSMRVPVEAWNRAKEQKEAHGRTWGEQIVRPEGEVAGEVALSEGSALDSEALAESIRQGMDADTPEDVREQLAEVLEELNDLAIMVDRVPTRTAEQTAEELEGRFS